MKYIDADKLIAEIENIRREFYYKGEQNLLHDAEIIRRSAISSCNDFLFLIDSLQQEQPEVDLDGSVKAYIKDNFTLTERMAKIPEQDRMYSMGVDDMTAFARHFYELGLNARK